MRRVYVSSPDVDDAAGGFLVDFLVVDLVLVADALVAVVLVVFLLAAVVRLRGVAAATVVVAVAGSGAGAGSAPLALSTAAGLAPIARSSCRSGLRRIKLGTLTGTRLAIARRLVIMQERR